jgi:hypothetical protein
VADTLPCRYHLVLPVGQVEVHRLVLFVGVLATSIAIILFAVGASADAHAYAVQPQICLYLQTYVAPPPWPPDMDAPPNTHTHTHTCETPVPALPTPLLPPGLIRRMDALSAFVNGFILVIVANVPEV